ncbi:MAG: hypothetical protein ACTSU2_15980 [Promethearchaeota archaeon]
MRLLYNKGAEMKQKSFLKELKKNEANLNAYFRVKPELIEYNLIGFKIDDEGNKIIYLTEKGKKIYEMIMDIEKNILKVKEKSGSSKRGKMRKR